MKIVSIHFFKFLLALALCGTLQIQSLTAKGKDHSNNCRVLVVGLDNNVKSNYYYEELIYKALGVGEDQIDAEYNNSISDQIVNCNKDRLEFIKPVSILVGNKLTDQIRLVGDAELVYSDLSVVDSSCFDETLKTVQANYLLVINQHYLKHQQSPFTTVYHYVSYSLYDVNQKEIYRNNVYTSSLALENEIQLAKSSKKSSAKIASSIQKALQQ